MLDRRAGSIFRSNPEVSMEDVAESAESCFYNAPCTGSTVVNEFVQIVPVVKVRERLILQEMRVQLVSVCSGKYRRATHVAKYLT
ncbi:hypothetical protein PR003_g4358 [Phytophthora rubi]|uniref:Uncharacterized protein n=1 Tax=Phytophthora rubi TaxID=129364 RepID=A0A6A4FV74_9STRA|nr:hypothetical protein PR002_g6580 [Phytophthora rubi]KAE9352472.1 hypothetical protein PR003_g4358 [Phytophthora rubi]